MALESINPKNKQLIKSFDELTTEQIEAKLAQAQNAFEELQTISFADRSTYMLKVAELLRSRKVELARIITDEVGKTLSASEAEIEKCAATCEFYAENAGKFLAAEQIKTDGTASYVRFDPIGVVLAVMPWNFPFWQVFRFAAPALMAGNAGVLKHASNVQMSAAAIEDIFVESGFPAGSFVNLAIGSAKVEAVIRDPRIKAITLTGSEKAGSAVARTAGEEIKKTVLELGGSDPFIVLADADLDAAVAAAVTARMQYNGGQSCIAAKRFIVEEPVIKNFTEKLKIAVNQLRMGDPTETSTDIGPLANEQMVADVEQQIKKSVEMGAQVISGGERGDLNGCYFQPTIVTELNLDMPVCAQETFGPVFAVISAKDVDEAINIANSSPYGLGANLFSSDIQKAQQYIVSKIESGAVFINGPMKSDPRLPFGGVKKSGYGRELSHYGIKEFVNVKTIWVK